MIVSAIPDAIRSLVSRETAERVTILLAEVERWNSAVNLVSQSTLATAWVRHVLDSLQVIDAWDGRGDHWVDLGSGGGFPGLVIAAVAVETHPDLQVTLIESDARKAAFLMQVSRLMGLTVTVRAERIESIPCLDAQIVSSRALAPLEKLLGLAHPHMVPDAVGLFSKGAAFRNEIEAARLTWAFDCDVIASVTDPSAAILRITGLAHV